MAAQYQHFLLFPQKLPTLGNLNVGLPGKKLLFLYNKVIFMLMPSYDCFYLSKVTKCINRCLIRHTDATVLPDYGQLL